MPIFINGNQYEDEAHMEAAYSPMLKNMGVDVQPLPQPDKKGEIKPPDVDPNMVVTPNEMMTNKQLNEDSITDDILGGTEISFKQPLESPTEPAGALIPQAGTQVANVEDRRQEPSKLDLGSMATGILNSVYGYYPALQEVPPTELAKMLGLEDIKIEKAVDQTSPINAAIQGTVDGTNFFGRIGQVLHRAYKHGMNSSEYWEPTTNVIDPNLGIPEDSDLKAIARIGDKLFGRGGTERYKTWPELAIRSAIDALKLPGDALAGKVDPMSEEGRQRTLDLALTLVGAPAPVAAKMADGTLGSFAGVKSATIKGKLNKLGEAQVMEMNGLHADDIFKQTGFFRGADKRWRYEIDDSKATLHPQNLEKRGGVAYLSDIFAHKELYEAYPDLKYVTVQLDDSMSGASFGNATGQRYIRLGTKTMDDGRIAAKDKGILMHEIQHAIQDIEGFAPGAFFEGIGRRNDPKVDYYLRSAGETESRNVDTRTNMSANARAGYPPTWSEDYPRSRQIVTRGVGKGTDQGLEDLQTGAMMRNQPIDPNLPHK